MNKRLKEESADAESSKRQRTEELPSLIEAVKDRCSLELAQRIIDSGVNLEATDRDGKTALMHAVINDHLVLATTLISAGADIKAVDLKNWSVLLYAVSHMTSGDFVENLLELGADISVQNELGDTALLLACKKNKPHIVQILLKYHASVSVQNKTGATALIIATNQGSPEIMKILLSAGADVNVEDNIGENALFKVKNEESMLILLKESRMLYFRNKNGDTLLLSMVKRVQPPLDCIKVLLQSGLGLLWEDMKGNTPLMAACNHSRKENLDLVKLFLERGANPSHKNKDGHCALLYAISWGHINTMKLLLAAGANPSSHDNNGDSLLMKVCQCLDEFKDIFSILINAGANISARNNKRKTALIFSMQQFHSSFVKTLIVNGMCGSARDIIANVPNVRNANFVTLVTEGLAIHSRRWENAIAILKTAVENGQLGDLKNVLLQCTDLMVVQDELGKTLLMMACEFETENVDVVKLLVRNGANVSAQDNNGQTALMLAFQSRFFEIVQYLINAPGVNVSTQNHTGNTMLMMACEKGKIRIVKQLLHAGACISTENDENITALVFAASYNHLDIVCLLLESGASLVQNGVFGGNLKSSTIVQIFKNRLKDKIHADYELTLKTITDKFDDNMTLLYEVIKAYIYMCPEKDHQNFELLFKEFTKQIIELAISKITPSTLLKPIQSVMSILIVLAADDFSCCENVKVIFDTMIQTPFKCVVNDSAIHELTTTCLVHDVCDDMLEYGDIETEMIGYLIHSYHIGIRYACWNEDAYKVFWNSLENLLSNGFSVTSHAPNCHSPLTMLMGLNNRDQYEYVCYEKFVLQVAEYFIKLGVNKYQHLLRFSDPRLALLKQKLQLPDALWLAFQNNHSSVLPLLLPYWSAPPLALFMFLPSVKDYHSDLGDNVEEKKSDFHVALKNGLRVIVPISGALPPGHKYIQPIQNYLDSFAQEFEGATELADEFRKLHIETPPRLKDLCRYVIRGCTKSGEDLPQRLSPLVKSSELKAYLTLTN